MAFKTTATHTLFAAGLAAALAAPLSVAAPAAAAEISVSDLKVSLGYPKPWPLRNLIAPGKLVIATTGKTPKETFVGDNGQLQGARIDLWTKMAADLGLTPEFVTIDWAGVLPGLAANRFDMACEGASWTNERLASPDFFLTRPVKLQVHVALVRKDSGIKTFADAVGKPLGGVKGEAELKSLLDKVGAKEDAALTLPGVAEARLALLNKQIAVYATGLHAAVSVMSGPDGDKFALLPEPTSVGVGGLCVNKREPDLLNATNFLLAKYRADGTIKALNEKWGLPDTSEMLATVGY